VEETSAIDAHLEALVTKLWKHRDFLQEFRKRGYKIDIFVGRIGNPKAFFAPPSGRPPPLAATLRPRRLPCPQRAAARLCLVLDMRLRMA